ncbi:MAG: O-antigen ligase family protein [Sulfobacillus sp.]
MQRALELRSAKRSRQRQHLRDLGLVSGYLALAIVLGAAVTQGIIFPAMIVAVLAVIIIWKLSEPQAVIILILGVIFIDRSPIVIHQSYVRLYQIFSIPIVARWMGLRLVQGEKIRFPKGAIWAGLWVASFVMAYPILVSRTEFFVEFLGMAYLLFLQIVVCDVIIRYDCWSSSLWAITISGLIVVVSGLLQYPLLITHILHTVTYGGFVRPFGLMREPDWYGVASGITMLLVIHHRKRFRSAWYKMFVFGCLFGVLASLARASWLSLGISLIVLAAMTGPDQQVAMNYIKYGLWAVLGMGVLLTAIDLHLVVEVIARFSPVSIGVANQSHVLALEAWDSRLASIRLMMFLIHLHPWIGNGAGIMGKLSNLPSIQSIFAYGGQLNTGRATTNVILAQLASVGIIGTVPFVIWLGNALVYGLKKSQGSPIIGVILILCLVDFQFNSGTGYGFFWIFMGMAGVRMSPSMSRVLVPSPSPLPLREDHLSLSHSYPELIAESRQILGK